MTKWSSFAAVCAVRCLNAPSARPETARPIVLYIFWILGIWGTTCNWWFIIVSNLLTDYDLWEILDKIGVLCGWIAQATRWLATRAWLKTTQGTSIFHLRPTSDVPDAWWRNDVTLALLSLFLALFPPRGATGQPLMKKKPLGPTYHEGGYQYMLGYMVDL